MRIERNRMRTPSWAVLSILVTASLSAQSFEKILLPIQPSAISGAFNSKFNTLLAERSDSDQAVQLQCRTAACESLQPHGAVLIQANGSADPAFVYVPSDQASSVFFALRTIATTGDGARTTMEIPI